MLQLAIEYMDAGLAQAARLRLTFTATRAGIQDLQKRQGYNHSQMVEVSCPCPIRQSPQILFSTNAISKCIIMDEVSGQVAMMIICAMTVAPSMLATAVPAGRPQQQ